MNKKGQETLPGRRARDYFLKSLRDKLFKVPIPFSLGVVAPQEPYSEP